MTDDQLSPEEQEIVRQIQATSKPQLDPAARDAIRQRMVTEFRAVTVSEPSHLRLTHRHFPFRRVAVLVAAMIVAVIGLVIIQSENQNITGINVTVTLTLSPNNQVAVVPSETPSAAIQAATSTVVVTPVPSLATELSSSTLTATQGILSPPPTESPDIVVNIEGPVTSIVNNIVTIYGFSIEVAPQHPILQVIDVGDIVRVQGVLGSSGSVTASVVSNIPDTDTTPINGSTATVGLDGPVEAINGNTIIVNSIPVQLAPNDPLLQTVQVGNFVSVQGNFQTKDTTIVLAVVNIAIINNTIIQSDCWYHVDAMGMGHWHCDGMGMGMGESDGMGMGEPDGMGDDAMGMGG